MTRLIAIAALCLGLAACGGVTSSDGTVGRVFGEVQTDHPLNGRWEQSLSNGETNRLYFNPVASTDGDRFGHYAGMLVDRTHNEIDIEWASDPEFTYRGTLLVTYDAGLLLDPPAAPNRGNHREVACSFEVNRERTEVTFGAGCVLFAGTFVQPAQPESQGFRGFWGN